MQRNATSAISAFGRCKTRYTWANLNQNDDLTSIKRYVNDVKTIDKTMIRDDSLHVKNDWKSTGPFGTLDFTYVKTFMTILYHLANDLRRHDIITKLK